MEKEFVPYELAVKLKELGFDEPCIYYFNKSESNLLWQDIGSGYYRNSVVSVGNILWGETYDNGNVSAPLWQQAFDWFREDFNLLSCIGFQNDYQYSYEIYDIKNKDCVDYIDKIEAYEEARKYCLEKLIELVEIEKYKLGV